MAWVTIHFKGHSSLLQCRRRNLITKECDQPLIHYSSLNCLIHTLSHSHSHSFPLILIISLNRITHFILQYIHSFIQSYPLVYPALDTNIGHSIISHIVFHSLFLTLSYSVPSYAIHTTLLNATGIFIIRECVMNNWYQHSSPKSHTS